MSLTEQAIKAITSYRTEVLAKPTAIEEESAKLLLTCKRLGLEDNNIFYSARREDFVFFPSTERFDREEYMTFRYLYESSYHVRRTLCKSQKDRLKMMIEKVLENHNELGTKFEEEYGIWVKDGLSKRIDLKTEALLKGLDDSKSLFTFKKVLASPEDFDQNIVDWVLPSEYKNKLFSSFKNSSKEIATKWGSSPTLLDYYISHVDLKKVGERIAIVSGISAGAILAAWGVSNAIRSSGSANSGNVELPLVPAIGYGAIQANENMFADRQYFGFDNFPSYLALPSNQVMANQAGFLNYLDRAPGTNQFDLQIANMNLVNSILNPQVDYQANTVPVISTPQPLVLPSLGVTPNNGNIMGCKAVLSELTSPDGNMTQIYGTINGQNVMTTFKKFGNTHWIS